MMVWRWQAMILILSTILLLIHGCSGTISSEVQKAVRDARAHFEIVNSLEVQGAFPDDYLEAQRKLVEAENYLQAQSDKALPPAKQSLTASQRILRQFYGNTITPLAKRAKAKIEEIAEEDPENPLKEFLPKLDELLDYSEKVESGEEIIALTRVLEDLEDVININDNTDKNLNTTLESDVTFDTGKYELSEKGRKVIRDFFRDVLTEQREHIDQFIKKSITMKIKVVGYTDQQGFRKGTQLVKKLTEGSNEEHIPKQSVDLRRFLNQRLSQFRANIIGEYVRQLVELTDSQIYIELDTVGLGEELPPDVIPKYPASDSVEDSRRRICKIYTYVIAR